MTSSSQPLLAVIIPIHGPSSLLIDAVESALRQQTAHAFRVVLVNDGCPSPLTDQLCRRYALSYPERVLYVRKRAGGRSSALNHGVRVALDAWPAVRAVYLLDAADRLHPHALERSYAALRADPTAGWAYPDVHEFGARRRLFDTSGTFRRLRVLAGNHGPAGVLVRREVFEAGVGFDESLPPGDADWDFWLRAVAAGFTGRHVPAAGYLRRARPENSSTDAMPDRAAVADALRRKHARLFTPRAVKAWEQDELPRFAIYLPDREQVIWTSDLDACGRRQTWAEFTRALRRNRACPRLEPVPPTLVVTGAKTLELLRERGVAANLFWLLEADLEEHAFFFLTVGQSMGVEVRVELSKPFAPDAGERRASVLCALRTSLLADWLHGARPPDLDAALGGGGALPCVGRRLHLEHLERPVPLPGDGATFLGDAANLLRVTRSEHSPWPLRLTRNFADEVNDAGSLASRLFGAPAAPPLHRAEGERHVGFVVPVAEFGGVERIVCNWARECRRRGWRTHLFVVGSGRACLLAEFKEAFDSLHLVPDEALARPARLVGLLGTMDVVVNNHSVPLNAALGELRRLGVRLVTHLQLVDLSGDGVPCGHPYFAADHEPFLDRVVVVSRRLRAFMTAKGVPPEKLLHVPNAPSFAVPPERIDAALSERAARPADQPLRALFLARFDRQKGLDRLVDLVRACERRLPDIQWRVVGKAVLDDGSYAAAGLRHLQKYLHPPATDAHSLCRHYCWADVLILVSHYEGAPLTILEAQQLGCVPLATDCGAVREQIADGATGFLLENAAEPAAIKRQVLDLFAALQGDRARLVALAERAAAVRRAQPWSRTTRELTDCLDGWFPAEGAA